MKTFSKKPGNERLRDIPCPLCGSEKFKKQWKEENPFVKCAGCGCVYQNPQPLPQDLAGRYDGEYLEYELGNEVNFFNLMKLGLKDIRFDDVEEEIGPGGSIIDVGCATGMLLEYMKGRGWRTLGIEVCAPAARYGIENRKVDIHIGPLESAALPDSSFDVVHCSHLIEHLNSPSLFIKDVYRILKPGGYFIVTTPNIAGFQAKIFKYKWRSAIDDHMVLFSKGILKRNLIGSGFSIIRSKTWGGLAVGAGSGILKPLLDWSAKRFGFGDVMIFLARK